MTDESLLQRYRFGSRTADYLVCRNCGVYIGAICDTVAGRRSVINTRSLDDRVQFSQVAVHPDYDQESTHARLARRAANWTPTDLRLTP